MSKKILVTGGAGFIGSHLVDGLVKEGHEVRVLDNLDKQVHVSGKKPDFLNKKAEFVQGDVRNKENIAKALEGVEAVFHFASTVGVGQSMYEINYYVDTNNGGTANLMEWIVNKENEVKKIIVAASMSSYGEGLYKCEKCGLVEPEIRGTEQLNKKKWELLCKTCGSVLRPVPTPESKTQHCNSIYALTKKDQEEMVLMLGKAYGIPSVALRFFNVYGTRQQLSNPYTGVAAIFMSRIMNKQQPVVYEDGMQTRDFISVHDVVEANILALNSKKADYGAFNVGSGKAYSIKGVAETIAKAYGSNIKPKVLNTFRKGDVRHCYADTSKIRRALGFEPKVSLEQGMKELINWSRGVKAQDNFEKAKGELQKRGLI
ncbi:MAG: NAD-dependent epimerase/dehydratase [archaeon GW2011_AR10]|uniref:SDR family NAD(P)-dependent oxidoreductase n=1 Tax=Candidatus Iainarchaeum sp. TaxID=3101447 RepID=A0A7J4ISS0_9ARCH|nr:MAG: NAD-dependent epimerase/dehydratase [archaeon GW2011_AR10]HIH08568.1 SDR family NAD(P)-dependent oxidoreductase [Candidatus Diapherotrites archaeon]